jgi:hypothetical protein
MRARVVLIVVVSAVLAALSCGPRPLTAQELCGPQGCDGCTGLQCSSSSDAGADAGP